MFIIVWKSQNTFLTLIIVYKSHNTFLTFIIVWKHHNTFVIFIFIWRSHRAFLCILCVCIRLNPLNPVVHPVRVHSPESCGASCACAFAWILWCNLCVCIRLNPVVHPVCVHSHESCAFIPCFLSERAIILQNGHSGLMFHAINRNRGFWSCWDVHCKKILRERWGMEWQNQLARRYAKCPG